MIFVLICIVLVCGLVVYQLMPKFLSYSPSLISKNRDSRELTHDGITDVLTQLGHPKFEGVCYGFTLNWALAVAQGKESFFTANYIIYGSISLIYQKRYNKLQTRKKVNNH